MSKKNLDSDQPIPRATQAQMRERRMRLEELLVMQYDRSEIIEMMFEEFQIKEPAVEKLITQIYKRWSTEEKQNVESKRQAQERRLLHYIRTAFKISDKARCERIYAKIVGTEAPVKLGGHDGGPVKMILEVVDYRAPEAPEKKKK